MNIRNLFVAAALVSGISLSTACSKSPLDELEKVKDEVCACKDFACAEAAMKKMDQIEEPKEASAADIEKAGQIAAEMMACATKLQPGAAAP